MCVGPLANRLLLLPATASRLALTDMPDADRAASGSSGSRGSDSSSGNSDGCGSVYGAFPIVSHVIVSIVFDICIFFYFCYSYTRTHMCTHVCAPM